MAEALESTGSPPSHPLFRILLRLGWVVPVALAAILYARAIEGELVWDDSLVQKDELIAFHDAGDVFFLPKDVPQLSRNYYRPLVMLTYLAERSRFGPAATRGPHATVIVFHLIATFFVWLLARRVLRGWRWGDVGALVAGILFAVHPIHTEDVCWITARPDVVAAMFAIPAVLAALRYRDRGSTWALILSSLLFSCAVFSKEVAVSMIVVVPMALWLVPAARGEGAGGSRGRTGVGPRIKWRRWLPLIGLYLVVLAAYTGLRAANHLNHVALQAGWPDAMFRPLAALAYYLVKLVVPPPQTVYPLVLPEAALVVPVLAVAAGLLVLSVRLYRRGEPMLLLGLGWVLVTVAPSLAIAVGRISETPVAERYLYLPSVGMCLLAGWLVAAAWSRPRLRVVAGVLVLVVTAGYGYWSVGRVAVWKNDVTLWSDVTRRDPPAGLPWLNLGQAYFQRGDSDKAVACFNTALQRYTNSEGRALTWNSIGGVLREKDPDRAAAAFRKAIEERPEYATPYFNLGMIGLAESDRDRAATGQYNLARLDSTRTAFSQAIRYNQYYVWAYVALGVCESRIAVARDMAGDRAGAIQALREAREHLQTAYRLDPNGTHGREAASFLPRIQADLTRLGG